MQKIICLFFCFAILSLTGFWPSKIEASSLSWQLTYPSVRESTYMATATASGTVFASIRKFTDIDLLK